MTDLTALKQSLADLQTAVNDTTAKLEQTPPPSSTSDVSQADVDALTSQVEQAVTQLKSADASTAGAPPASTSATDTAGASSAADTAGASPAGSGPPWQGS